MGSLVEVLNKLCDVSTQNTGNNPLGIVNKIDDRHWIIGDHSVFPIQVELLDDDNSFLIYGTGVRATGEPVYTSFMVTLFVEGLFGHSLGRYGICPGAVTITIYQKVIWLEHYTIERMTAEITCHRLLTECFLEGAAADIEIFGGLPQHRHDDIPILPMCH